MSVSLLLSKPKKNTPLEKIKIEEIKEEFGLG